MDMAFNVASWVSIGGGLFFMIVGTIGILRLPDVFTRLHAAGMTDTMGAGLLILGMSLQTILSMIHGETSYWMVLVRLVLIYAFLMFTSPIATHALARAAIATGVEPLIVAEGDEE
ncbi:MAG: monovalent cation/H(+) antiporter subunit G [Gemmatimonadales bacterium]|jgi:multicomponent Na+:H+ antiporter subunit G|nr:monovalent cation/H(+) antiporter subunit G [Gemmatimonadales bacterium]MDG2238718.1 monovalent cation/H(+) antiporter subunit G [Longimicrobiales bacterium]MBT3498770.1 monovalent cation/H(+) antiporter subunit G [Gemmatimonadales bacterium]MBT3775205.1 monovalent cation/H(+) antiporter subunit G [Gemmatimonadales bacterium]MBT3956844.1 monovalent cation/H(+) antiporter subunit G [Gemmatimonadales bacterium]